MPTTEERNDLYTLTLDLMAACDVFTSEGWALALDLEDVLFLVSEAVDLAPAIRVLKVAAEAAAHNPRMFSPDLAPEWREDLISRVDFL